MTTDFRALCAELCLIWSRSTNPDDLFENMVSLVDRARAALAAEPEPLPDMEVAGTVTWLREFARVWEFDAPRFKELVCAADLLERLAGPETVGGELIDILPAVNDGDSQLRN